MEDIEDWCDKNLCKPWTTAEHTLNEIIDAIKNNKPLSYVRFGDADIILLKEWFNVVGNTKYFIDLCNASSELNPKKNNIDGSLTYYARQFQNEIINNYFNVKWKVPNDSALRYQIIDMIGFSYLHALEYASHIGVWDMHTVTGGTAENFYIWTHSHVPHIKLFAKCGADFKSIVNGTVNRMKPLADPYEFKKILNGKPLHIFTSNEHELRTVAKLDKLLETEITYTNLKPIPGNWTTYAFANHEFLHNRLFEIKESIILYGLGYGAKHIPAYAAKFHNKVCIDMGAVLDGWCGILSRPYMSDSESYMVPVPKEKQIHTSVI